MNENKTKLHLRDFADRSLFRFAGKRRRFNQTEDGEEVSHAEEALEHQQSDLGTCLDEWRERNETIYSHSLLAPESRMKIMELPVHVLPRELGDEQGDDSDTTSSLISSHSRDNEHDPEIIGGNNAGRDFYVGNGNNESIDDSQSGDESESDDEGDVGEQNNEIEPERNEQYDNDDDPEPDPQDEDPPLFEGAPMTRGETLACVLTFALRFSLTGVAIDALLKLISIICPTPNFCMKSLFLFNKYFAPITVPLRRRYYCSLCFETLSNMNSVCEVCPPIDRHTEFGSSYFVEVPLLDQLKTLYKRPGFVELLQKRFRRKKQNIANYEEIYDGKVYKELSKPGNFLSDPNSISLNWNSDGVKIFKSSKESIWPFFLNINELPYAHRNRKENLILAGLWFGKEKPVPSLFLNNICSDLDELRNGVNMKVPNKDQPIRVHGQVICGTCDLPAKALFLNMKQYNGEYGCQKCKIRSIPRNENSRARVYPYQESLPLRTQDETDRYAREAEDTGQENVYGVKGSSVISKFSRNYIRSTAIDSMHCVFLGVVRALLLLWFNSSDGLLSQFADAVDEKICSITPPKFVSRLPRSIIEHIMYLKAHELKAWFFYYSIPILQTIMSPVYFDHYLSFVYSIYVLNQRSVSECQITLAEKLLAEFVSLYSDLYGPQNMTANIHQLLHLPENVRDFGPLWTTSCFPFENANGLIKKLVTGTKFAPLQICTGVSLYINLPEITKNLVPGNPPHSFCQKLIDKHKKYKIHHTFENFAVVGVMEKMDDIPAITIQALDSSGIVGTNIRIFKRLLISGTLYTSELYRRVSKTNSMYAKYRVNDQSEYGRIYCFTKVSNCNCQNYCGENCDARYFAIMKECETDSPFSVQSDDDGEAFVPLSFVRRYVAMTNSVRLVDIHDLDCVCYFIKIDPDDIIYIVEPVNMLEME